MTCALRVRNLVKRFHNPGQAPTVALDDVSLDVESGTIVGVVGSNGAGKSTLLSVIAGSLLADQGSVEIAGRDVSHLPSWRRARMIARVRQNPETNLFASLSIEENFALRIAGKRGAYGLGRARTREIRKRAVEALKPFGMGLEDRLEALTTSLSGGQKQAVSVAISTLGDPDVLLLDEHVAALDPNSAKLVTERTELAIREHGTTTIMVTHDMTIALERSDRLLMLSRGGVVLDLDAEEKRQYDIHRLVDLFEKHSGEALPDRVILG